MEFLIAAGVTVFGQIFKYFLEKFGDEKKAKNLILVGVFCLSISGTYLYSYLNGDFSLTNFDGEKLSQIFFVAIGYYEVVVKRLIIPALNTKLE